MAKIAMAFNLLPLVGMDKAYITYDKDTDTVSLVVDEEIVGEVGLGKIQMFTAKAMETRKFKI